MKKFILGTKVGMTQVFDENGVCIPVTVVKAGPLTVVQKKTVETDGYNSIRVGFQDVEAKKLNKPDNGLFTKIGASPKKYIKEFRAEDSDSYEVGAEILVQNMFAAGDKVDVSGTSKGKGFAGSVKRHGNKICRMSHGSKYHRGVGSMGPNSTPSRVFKGKKMPGHMGFVKCTIQNLDVVRVDEERGLLLIKGAVPGPKGSVLTIKDSVKSK